MARRDNSESDTGKSASGNSNSRSAVKHRQQALIQQQKEFVLKYVHKNGPSDFPKKDPMDFSNWSVEQLRKYRELYLNPSNIISPDVKTFQGFMLENSKLGESTDAYIKNEMSKEQNVYDYRTNDDLRKNVEEHFNSQLNVKESEVITNFIYKVKNEDKKFRIYFDKRS
ncbi:unnamed protein product [Ambrosiozyma monospora]|uniref:Unnamed protein product n=1 Tax=Ambrosiozyma monospora TaxID=43982 RepID=A0ACB5TEJ6_AMBMO|nr:unnamed protein product [Ambrosiozyma monospora]